MSSTSNIDWDNLGKPVPLKELLELKEQIAQLGKGPVAVIVEALTDKISEMEKQAITAMAVALIKSGKDVTELELVRELQGTSVVMYFRIRQYVPKSKTHRMMDELFLDEDKR